MAKKKRLAAIGGAAKVLRTTFGGLPIVDAKADFSLVVRTRDLQAATGHEKDASNCILAKACANQLGSSTVAFFRTIAYVELPDSKGTRRVVRYLLDKDAAAIVRAFDRGQTVKGEVTVTLRAPPRSGTLDAALKRYHKSRSRKAVVRGTIVNKSPTAGVFKKPKMADMDVRNGTGLVHNTLKTAKERVGS